MLPNFSVEWSPDHQRTLILYWELVARDGWVMVTLLKYWQRVTALRIRQLYFDKGRTEKARINCCFPIQGNEHQKKCLWAWISRGKKPEDRKHIYFTTTADMLISSITLWKSSSELICNLYIGPGNFAQISLAAFLCLVYCRLITSNSLPPLIPSFLTLLLEDVNFALNCC